MDQALARTNGLIPRPDRQRSMHLKSTSLRHSRERGRMDQALERKRLDATT